MRHVLLLILYLGFASMSVAQEEGLKEDDLKEEAVKQIVIQTEDMSYMYDPEGKKDPFKPYRAPRARGDNRQAAPVDPLMLLEMSKVKLVAVLWDTAMPKAVIIDESGNQYVLQKNMRIGKNEGVVADIRDGQVIVVEKFDDGLGNIVREARTLEMKINMGKQQNKAAEAPGG